MDKILKALNEGNDELARDLLLEDMRDEAAGFESWDSPNYKASELIKATQANIRLERGRDRKLTYFGLEVLRDRYLLKRKNGEICENPQQFFARVAAGLSGGNQQFAQNLYDAISNLEFMPATPILTNTSTDRGHLISCFLNTVGDSVEDIFKTYEENAFLSRGGGGIGTDWSQVRGKGATQNKTGKSSGTIPFLKVMDSATTAINQGNLRRGSAAAYMDIHHPDIEEFLIIRKPTGGDLDRKCLNLHHGINITDDFMRRVEADMMFDLICPDSGKKVKEVNARELWMKIIKTRVETGEPYLLFIDTVNEHLLPSHRKKELFVRQSNLCCVPANVKILTRQGNIPIGDIEDSEVEVWNGHEWSLVTPKHTGYKEIYEVTLSDGSSLQCSDNHKFHLQKGYTKGGGENKLELYVKEAKDLVPGEKLQKCTYPVIEFDVTTNHSVESRLKWLAGVMDSEGCVINNKGAGSVEISSVNRDFLLEIKEMLITLGVSSRVSKFKDLGKYFKYLLSDKKGDQDCYRLSITGSSLQQLLDLGLKTNRLTFSDKIPNRSANHFVKVLSVNKTGVSKHTYCFNEPKNHTAIFDGVYTGQSEITLPTDRERTAVCCLGSINYEAITTEDRLKEVVGLAVEALDNVLTLFIDNADPRDYKRAIYSASKERSIGLGVMGYHGMLMKRGIPFDEGSFLNARYQQIIKDAARIKSEELALRKGDCDDNPGFRNSYLTAIAPTANISVICGGATPCIEPIAGNAYLQKTLSGSFLVKNKYLKEVLAKYGKDDQKTWTSIIQNKGSVQHLKFLKDYEKEIFRTAYEIDQMFIVEQAAARQKHICQSQSLNLFFPVVDGQIDAGYVSRVHYESWRLGVKSLYYLRSDTALNIKISGDEEEDCEVCQ